MTLNGAIQTVRMDIGFLRTPMGSGTVVGDRLVPTPIEVELPGADGQPALNMRIEVIAGVPRCTELILRRNEGGREIRTKDLKTILETGLDTWIELFVAVCSGEITKNNGKEIAATYSNDAHSIRQGMKTISEARKESRRPLTEQRLQRVAEVYRSQESDGIAAVQAAFGVSRSTASRYIRAAREIGILEMRKK